MRRGRKRTHVLLSISTPNTVFTLYQIVIPFDIPKIKQLVMTYREFERHPDWMKYPSADSMQNDKRNRRGDRSSFRRTMKNFVAEPFSIERRFRFQSFHAAEPLVFKWPKGPSRFYAIVVPPYQSCLKKGRFLFKQSQLIYKLG